MPDQVRHDITKPFFSERSIFMESTNKWRLQRQVSVSVLVQLITLAGLILTSWVNLQRQLDIVSHDVKQLLTAQQKLCDKLEIL
jgi:hypothetical protein